MDDYDLVLKDIEIHGDLGVPFINEIYKNNM